MGQFGNGDIRPRPDVDQFRVFVAVHNQQTGFGEVVSQSFNRLLVTDGGFLREAVCDNWADFGGIIGFNRVDLSTRAFNNEGQIAFRYAEPDGAVTEAANPNGSRANIAGIVNAGGNVLGMMPHPERLADPALSGTDGRGMFDGLVEAFGAEFERLWKAFAPED